MKLTESRLRQIIREELSSVSSSEVVTEATMPPNEAYLQPAPESGRLELVIKNFHNQSLYTEFLDALSARDLGYIYATYRPGSVTAYNELDELEEEYFGSSEEQFVGAVDAYIQTMQARMA
jgi:hypothetical protein